MKAKNLCTYAGLCAGFASVAVAGGDKPTPQMLGNAIEVIPQRVARVRMENGAITRVSDWTNYNGSGTRDPNSDRVFDCFGDSNADGVMDGGIACGQSQDTIRWFFGTGYCNGTFTNDMTLDPATNLAAGLGRFDTAWYWACGGSGAEDCELIVFTQESSPEPNCELDSGDYSGWILDFGTLSCNPGGYYYTNVDLFGSQGGTWTAPTGGVGSYQVFYTTSDGGALATCSQPMLWGTGDATGGDPNNPGHQGPNQLDDDAPLDGSHTTSECYTYSAGLCPDPLGGMGQWWGELGGDECDFADFDNNGVVDTRDFTAFFNQWVPKNAAADCDENGVVDTRDVTCFLNKWNACR